MFKSQKAHLETFFVVIFFHFIFHIPRLSFSMLKRIFHKENADTFRIVFLIDLCTLVEKKRFSFEELLV